VVQRKDQLVAKLEKTLPALVEPSPKGLKNESDSSSELFGKLRARGLIGTDIYIYMIYTQNISEHVLK
jgi:hypothetical protein